MKQRRTRRPLLRKVLGALLILLGVGVFAGYQVMGVLYPPMDTDIASILDRQVPPSTDVRIAGTLSDSDFTVTEGDADTGAFRGIRFVYRLTDDSSDEPLSILVVSDDSLEEGERVVEGRLLVRPYGLPGYVVEVPDESLIPLDWLCAGSAAIIVLLGIVLLVTAR
jgi:hypothetical protein